MKITTTAFIFHKDKLLIVFHRKLKRWMHVGGHVEDEEFLDDAIIREIKEETGLKVKILGNNLEFPKEVLEDSRFPQKQPFFIHYRLGKIHRTLAFDYVCVSETDEVVLKKDELLDYRWIARGEIDALDTTPFFKEFAKKAFMFYQDNK